MDLGILDARQLSEAEEDEGPENSTRNDITAALASATLAGSFCSSHKADGTSNLTPALPSLAGLCITSIGDVPLPLLPQQEKRIKSSKVSQLLNDECWQNTWSIDASKLTSKNPSWEASVEDLVKSVAYKFGIRPNDLRADMNMLLYMEAGSRVEWCIDDEDSNEFVGVMYIQLPSAFTGGEANIFFGQNEDEGVTETFDLGAGGEAQFACHYLAHFADCEYLRANLDGLEDADTVLTDVSGQRPDAERAAIAGEHITTSLGLIRRGLSALSRDHRSKAEAILSSSPGWTLLIVNCKLVHKQETGYYGEMIKSSKSNSVSGVYDVEGRDVSAAEKPFLRGALDFTSAARNHSGVDPGMVLTTNEGVALGSTWGSSSLTSSEERYYGGHNKTYSYNATFLLAYDSNYRDVEFECLKGEAGTSKIAASIVSFRDYGLFERLATMLESKHKCVLNTNSCQVLLEFLLRSRVARAKRISFSTKVVAGLSLTNEPNANLYSTILTVCGKLGCAAQMASCISLLLQNSKRKKDRDLSVFLRRADFLLKFNRLDSSSLSLQSLVINDMNSSKRTVDSTCTINELIYALISTHGAHAVAAVVRETLSFLSRHHSSNISVVAIMDRASLISKMNEEHSFAFLADSFNRFANEFSSMIRGMLVPSFATYLAGENKRLGLKAISWVLEHGNDRAFDNLGKWIAGSENETRSLVTALSSESEASGTLALSILNKCAVQQRSEGYGWSTTFEDALGRSPPSVPPSLHTRIFLAEFPGITSKRDSVGRVTLHYAVDNEETPFDTIHRVLESFPRAASILDPVTKLYPFMQAGMNSQVDATFSLLLENPSLVTGVHCNQTTNKRKRSPSMDFGFRSAPFARIRHDLQSCIVQ
ncbi:hypothetical protein THAOC_25723 [Thalassiosira oceanica]|uniref:Uncharacterized protein n=1 Tax=Thalassiosira oceanica TaxID=159749 RepID=K0S714_THAOC|nr:hypothetical protein THAOC_25723 [Thalassiosira oceanica]|eukprot:EJK54632.1 hypothetical protein THAOC_25723 [Thalassiosira oceanica]